MTYEDFLPEEERRRFTAYKLPSIEAALSSKRRLDFEKSWSSGEKGP